LFNLAFAYQKSGKFENAIDTYLEASDIQETRRSYVNIAICYKELGDEEQSEEFYKKADALGKRGG